RAARRHVGRGAPRLRPGRREHGGERGGMNVRRTFIDATGRIGGGPFPDQVRAIVTSPFGPRTPFWTPAGPTSNYHTGIDLAVAPACLLVAISDGYVEVAQAWHPSVGNWIRIAAGDGWTWDYYHMRDVPTLAAG